MKCHSELIVWISTHIQQILVYTSRPVHLAQLQSYNLPSSALLAVECQIWLLDALYPVLLGVGQFGVAFPTKYQTILVSTDHCLINLLLYKFPFANQYSWFNKDFSVVSYVPTEKLLVRQYPNIQARPGDNSISTKQSVRKPLIWFMQISEILGIQMKKYNICTNSRCYSLVLNHRHRFICSK